MQKQEYLDYCHRTYGTLPDYPFEDLHETAVLRHGDNRKWYAIVMRGSPARASVMDLPLRPRE